MRIPNSCKSLDPRYTETSNDGPPSYWVEFNSLIGTTSDLRTSVMSIVD